jgi:nucleotide-binding universal stress UspA family protein
MHRRILLALDIEQVISTPKIIATAVNFASRNDAEIYVLTVLQLPKAMITPYLPEAVTEHAAHAVKEAEEQLDLLARKSVPSSLPCHTIVRYGSVYRQVLAVSKEREIDLIVIGSHHPEIGDFLLGSNSAKIVRHATCTVTVVRE